MANPLKIAVSGNLEGPERLAEVSNALEEACKTSTGMVLADLSGLRSIDYDAVVMILTMRNKRENLQLIDIPENIRKIIEIFRIPV